MRRARIGFRRAWWCLVQLARRIEQHRIGLAAAGCAFYATLALFPAASMLISVYGLAFDPRSVEPQLAVIQPLLPTDAFSLLQRVVEGLTAKPRGTLGFALLLAAAITLWSASTGVKSLLEALNLAYDEPESRSILRFQATALVMTAAGVLGATLAIALLVALPAAAAFVELPASAAALLHAISLGVMMLYVAVTLAGLYRFGPSRDPTHPRRILPGTVTATLLWLAASALFSVYAERIAHFDATYGPLGAIATIMLWFWVSCYAVLIGAELNAVLEGAPPPRKA
jgi:membrane protein